LKKSSWIAVMLLISWSLAGCVSSHDKRKESEELYSYKNAYVGDNSAVGNILARLPGDEFFQNMALHTSNRPYRIEVNYGIDEGSDAKSEQAYLDYWGPESYKNLFIGNATVLFALLQNADAVTFQLDQPLNRSVTINKEELDTIYGHDVKQFAEMDDMWKNIFEELNDSQARIERFYSTQS
jgi:hypothetical protein